MEFSKYHALGNDYLVLSPSQHPDELSIHFIERVCHRNFGLGSDGILLGPLPSTTADFRLRIFNPDGSEAEKSGNGLRIFARHLHDCGLVQGNPFSIETQGGIVRAQVFDPRTSILIEMGRIRFDSAALPMTGPSREVLLEPLTIDGETLRICCASIGNPHCVVPRDEISPEMAQRFGPLLERHPLFPRRTNVQFLRVIDRQNIQIEIWERGAGYTLASGSSSSASAAVARRLGLIDPVVTVHMPGGKLQIEIDEHYGIRMYGPVTQVGLFTLAEEALS